MLGEGYVIFYEILTFSCLIFSCYDFAINLPPKALSCSHECPIVYFTVYHQMIDNDTRDKQIWSGDKAWMACSRSCKLFNTLRWESNQNAHVAVYKGKVSIKVWMTITSSHLISYQKLWQQVAHSEGMTWFLLMSGESNCGLSSPFPYKSSFSSGYGFW